MKSLTHRLQTRFAIALVSIAAIFILLSPQLKSQSTSGSVIGTVTDSSGAIVPGASVTLTNTGTNEKKSVKTDNAGNYQFANVLPAVYKIEIDKSGFKRFIRVPVEVQVGAAPRIDVAMEVGSATETVEVTTQAPLLETESGSVSSEVEGKTVQEMPLNGRNTMNLIALAPGVVPQGSTQGGTGLNQPGGNTNNAGWGNYQIGGGIAGQSAEYIDGVTLNTIGGNAVALVPTQDAVQEFSVASNSVAAEFGRFAGGVVNMATKSGTNKIHGSAYEYLRNADFNSNEWFNKQNQLFPQDGSTPVANKPLKWNQNQYGVVAQGPIKRDKAFFLFTWEAFKLKEGQTSTANVPTPAEISGILPEHYTKGVLDQVSDPTGKCAITHQLGTQAAPGTWTIPSSCNDSAANVMKGYWIPSNSGVYTAAVPVGEDQNQYNARVDYNLSKNQQLFARYTRWNISDISFNQFPGNKFNLGNDAVQNLTNQIVLGDTYTISPTTILDVRLGWMRQWYSQTAPSTSVNEAQFGGTWAALAGADQLGVHMYPKFSLGGQYSSIFNSFESGPPGSIQYFNNYSLGAGLTKIAGKHTMKLGAEIRKMNLENAGGSDSGNFDFTNAFTGDNFADFLLGYASDGNIAVGSRVTGYNYYQA